ncbi:hypothetical protein F4774DRAFT_192087 [Daldinia eschscholtzii]|nr:hypothetical protein F4774DRAFT_192087 [Daldinia eschscholtzii]
MAHGRDHACSLFLSLRVLFVCFCFRSKKESNSNRRANSFGEESCRGCLLCYYVRRPLAANQVEFWRVEKPKKVVGRSRKLRPKGSPRLAWLRKMFSLFSLLPSFPAYRLTSLVERIWACQKLLVFPGSDSIQVDETRRQRIPSSNSSLHSPVSSIQSPVPILATMLCMCSVHYIRVYLLFPFHAN